MDRSTTIASSGKFVFDEVSNVLFSIGAGRVTRWDATSGQFLSAIDIGANLSGIAISPDGRYLLVGSADLVPTPGGGNSVALFRIDLTTMARTTITTPQAFYEGGVADIVIDADGFALFTTHFQGSGWTPLRRFDVAAETPTMSNVAGGPDVTGGTAMIRSPNGEFVLVLESNISNAPFALYSASQDRIIARSDLYRIGQSGFNDGRGDVSNVGDIAIITYNTFVIYDRDLNVVRDFTSRQSAGSIADAQFSADGQFLFVLNIGSDVLEVIRVSDWSLTYSVPLGVDLYPTGNGSIYNGLDLIDDGGLLLLTTAVGVRVIDLAYASVIFTGTPANDRFSGALGHDTLNGDGGDDTLDGRSGDDILDGGAGDDVLSGGLGDDRIDGGSGHDILIVSGDAAGYRLLQNGDDFILKGPDGGDSRDRDREHPLRRRAGAGAEPDVRAGRGHLRLDGRPDIGRPALRRISRRGGTIGPARRERSRRGIRQGLRPARGPARLGGRRLLPGQGRRRAAGSARGRRCWPAGRPR